MLKRKDFEFTDDEYNVWDTHRRQVQATMVMHQMRETKESASDLSIIKRYEGMISPGSIVPGLSGNEVMTDISLKIIVYFNGHSDLVKTFGSEAVTIIRPLSEEEEILDWTSHRVVLTINRRGYWMLDSFEADTTVSTWFRASNSLGVLQFTHDFLVSPGAREFDYSVVSHGVKQVWVPDHFGTIPPFRVPYSATFSAGSKFGVESVVRYLIWLIFGSVEGDNRSTVLIGLYDILVEMIRLVIRPSAGRLVIQMPHKDVAVDTQLARTSAREMSKYFTTIAAHVDNAYYGMVINKVFKAKNMPIDLERYTLDFLIGSTLL